MSFSVKRVQWGHLTWVSWSGGGGEITLLLGIRLVVIREAEQILEALQ